MVSTYNCDSEDGNAAVFTVSNQQTGDTLFQCALCFGLLGSALLKEMFPAVWAENIAPNPVPKKATGRKTKAADGPANIDPDRTIATIVESGPRPETGDADAGSVDASPESGPVPDPGDDAETESEPQPDF